MASLDDFFAKKDKRKKGKSKTFVTSELLAKTKEEQAAPQPPPETQENKVKVDLPAAPSQEDEWKEEEEVVKDFEGLRVQKLGREDDKVKKEKAPVTTESDENFTEREAKSKESSLASSSSPWQAATTPHPDEDDSAEPDSDLIPDTLPNVQGDVYIPASRGGGGGGGGGAYVPPAAREGGAYVPPHMKRGGGGGGSGSYVPPGMRRGGWGRGGRGSRLPPDLSSAVAFPSLHDVANKGEGSSSDKGSEFKEAQGPKTSRSSDVTHRAPGLELTNKFSGLENN